MTINEFAGKRYTTCDKCGDLISGEMPTKEDIQKSPTMGGISYLVCNFCSECSKYTKFN